MKRYNFVFCSAMVIAALAQAAQAKGAELYSAEELRFEAQNGAEKVFDQDGKAFSGAVILPDENGRKITYIYKDGQKNGVAVSRFADGKIEFETTYANGEKNGEEMLFSLNGKPQYKKTYKNNELDGEYIIFYDNGKPRKKNVYAAGKLNGESITFDEDGNIKHILHYQNGKKHGVERIVENNILKEENNYINGVLDGISKKYSDKYLTDEITYKNGEKDGPHITYSANGGKREVLYKNGKKEGVAAAYYPTGRMAQRVTYLQDKRNGIAEKWDEEGILRETESYRNDFKDGIGRSFNEYGVLQEVHYTVKDTVLASINIWQNSDLSEIYTAFLQGMLNEYSQQKNNWYKILWLGLSGSQPRILEELKQQMKMYGYDIDNASVYKKESGRNFADENRQLFFGLTPLSYAVNLAAPVEILQQFATTPKQINAQNARGTTALQEAVRLNNVEMVKFLLLHGADAKNNDVLLDAIKENARPEIIEELLKAGADVNQADAGGNTAVLLALKNNDAELMKLLIKHNADLTVKTPDNGNLLAYAYEHKAPGEIVELIVAAGVGVNTANSEGGLPLLLALEEGNDALAERLLKAGADVNKADANNQSALSYVLRHNVNDELKREIISRGDMVNNLPQFEKPLWQILADEREIDLLDMVLANISINQPDVNGTVPQEYLLNKANSAELVDIALKHIDAITDNLMFAALKNNNAETLRKLAEKGGNVNAKDANGASLLETALKSKADIAVLEALASEKLDVQAPMTDERQAVEIALENNDAAAVEFLLSHGADANIMKDGNILAATAGAAQEDATGALLAHGVDLQFVNADKQTVLMLAVKQLNLPLAEAFAAQPEKDMAARDNFGNTALHYLAEAGEKYAEMPRSEFLQKTEQMLRILTANGMNINEQNSNGETLVIRMAQKNLAPRQKIEELLQKFGADLAIKDQYRKTAADYWK